MTSIIEKVRKVLLKTPKRDVFSKIIKDLKTNSFFNFEHYELCYPDNPQSKTKGFFQMEINYRHDNTYVFQIEAVEGIIVYLDFYIKIKWKIWKTCTCVFRTLN